MDEARSTALAFYRSHPISEERVLDALRRRGKDLGRLLPEDLFELDQDHYGGLDAVLDLARLAGIGPGCRVLDVCAGLAGPARFLAHRFEARVSCLDLSPERALGARRLTALVGLDSRVRVVRGDAERLPFASRSFDAIVSQEGLLHVPDKAAVLGECARVLVPGGRIAFTDWTATPRLGDGERRRLAGWMAAVTLETISGYRALLGRAGFGIVEAEDLSEDWAGVLRRRLETFRAMRAETVARLGRARLDEYDQLFAFFVSLVRARRLGGGRFSATAGPGTS